VFTDVGAKLDGKSLPPWDRGVRVMLSASGGNNNANGSGNAPGVFESLRIEPGRIPEAEARAAEVRMSATKPAANK